MIRGVPYDAEVEYLESTGTQWIDTGVMPTNQSKIECDATWLFTSSGGDNPTLLGSRTSRPLTMFEILQGLQGEDRCLYYQYGGYSPYKAEQFGNRKVFTASGNILSIDGVAVITIPIATFSIPWSIALFALNKNGIIERFCKASVYRFKAWDAEGTLVRDFQPVRFTNELGQAEGAMYDRVTKKLFRNKGTGAFVVGPDVARPIMGLHFMKPRYTARDYVQDGLIAMWDGIENAGWGVHDAEATAWKDLAGEHTMTPSSGAVYGWGNDYFRYGGAGQITASNPGDFYLALVNGKMTVQSVFKDISGRSDMTKDGVIFGAHYRNVLIYLPANTRGKISSYMAYGYGLAVSYEHENDFSYTVTLQDSVQTAYINDVRKNSKSITPDPQYRSFGFGHPTGYGYEFIPVEMYATRVYSRALTADEIAHNYAVDKVRFKLPEVSS